MTLQSTATSPSGTSQQGIAGDFYSKLIDDQLTEERNRKTSLEQRGAGVITTAGTLVTLVFGFTAVVKGSNALHIPDDARLGLVGALFLLLIAVAIALLIGRPRLYFEVTKKGLEDMVSRAEWLDPNTIEARRSTARAAAEIIVSARSANDKKSNLLTIALIFEWLGVVCLAVAAMAIGLANA